MKQKPTYARPATAAIAAALAFITTPAGAQITAPDGAMDPAVAPIVPPPVQPQARPQPGPVKAKPAPVATAPVSPPRIAPVIDEAPAVPAVARSAPAASTPATRQRPARTASVAPSEPAARTASAVAAAPLADVEQNPSSEAETLPVAPVAAAEPIDMGESTGAPSNDFALGQDEQIALAALAGLLGLGAIGGTLVARRRRKPVADAPLTVATTQRVVEPEPMAAPAIGRTEAARPARKLVPLGQARVKPVASGALIDQIDYTKPAGYYESMVDQGPSPINPFLTARKRIARARFLDHQLELAEDRQLAEQGGDDFATKLRRPALV